MVFALQSGSKDTYATTNMLFKDFYGNIKDRRVIPLSPSASDNEILLQNFMKHMIAFVSNSMNNFLNNKPQVKPSLEECLIEFLKYQSYNPALAAMYGDPANFDKISQM